MSPSVESLADRSSRLGQSGEPEELPERPAVRQSRIRTVFSICLIFAGCSLILQGALSLVSVLASSLWEQALWGSVLLLAGLLFTYMASVIDRGFWGHFVKLYAIFGFLIAWLPGWHIVVRKVEDGDDLMNFLQGASMIVLALAVHFWRRGVERRMRDRERAESVEVFE